MFPLAGNKQVVANGLSDVRFDGTRLVVGMDAQATRPCGWSRRLRDAEIESLAAGLPAVDFYTATAFLAASSHLNERLSRTALTARRQGSDA